MIEMFFVDFLVSIISTILIYFSLKYLQIDSADAYIISMIVFAILFIISVSFSFYIFKIKQKIIFLNSQIEKLRKFDEITDVYNRGFLLENLKKYFDISKRKNIPLSLMIIEISNLQKIIDLEGFERANIILKKISDILKQNIRGMDIIGRYSLNEFIIASFSTKEEFYAVASRVHNLIQEEMDIEINIGIAQREKFDSLKDLLRKANEAVFLAQKKGGNRVDVLEHFLLIE